MDNKDANIHEYLNMLSNNAVMSILLELCTDTNIAKRVDEITKAMLAEVRADDIANDIFMALDAIDIEELWENSGQTRWGYNEMTDVAYEMVGDSIVHYIDKMKQYRKLNMKEQEKEYCKGIISGLLRYGQDGTNEFHENVPDDPYIYASDILDDWISNNTTEDIKEVQEVYDSFIGRDDEEEEFSD